MDKKKNLIVDDEKDVQSILAKLLTSHGYSVVLAGTGKEAVAMAASN